METSQEHPKARGQQEEQRKGTPVRHDSSEEKPNKEKGSCPSAEAPDFCSILDPLWESLGALTNYTDSSQLHSSPFASWSSSLQRTWAVAWWVEYLLSRHEALGQSPTTHKPHVVAHTCNSSLQDVEIIRIRSSRSSLGT